MKIFTTLLLFLLANFSFAKSQGEFFSCETTNNKILTLRKVGDFIEYEFAKKKPKKVELTFRNSIEQVKKFEIDSVGQFGAGRYARIGFAMINNLYVYEITSVGDRLSPNEDIGLGYVIEVNKIKNNTDLKTIPSYKELIMDDYLDYDFNSVEIKCNKKVRGDLDIIFN